MDIKMKCTILGIPDRIVEHGTLKELHRECGYDAQAIADAARELLKERFYSGAYLMLKP
jgi:1-deoxy-D-xylulose-5-phosphate synthase